MVSCSILATVKYEKNTKKKSGPIVTILWGLRPVMFVCSRRQGDSVFFFLNVILFGITSVFCGDILVDEEGHAQWVPFWLILFAYDKIRTPCELLRLCAFCLLSCFVFVWALIWQKQHKGKQYQEKKQTTTTNSRQNSGRGVYPKTNGPSFFFSIPEFPAQKNSLLKMVDFIIRPNFLLTEVS